MINFDDLSHTKRTLILATLQLEIAEANCTNILDLARKRNQDIHDLWRELCKKTGQPHCTVPAPVLATADPWRETMPAAAHLDSPPAVAARSTTLAFPEAPPSSAFPPPTSLKPPIASKAGGVNTAAAAVPVKKAAASSAHRAPNRRGLLVIGVVAILSVGVGLLVMVAGSNSTVSPQTSLQIPNAKPGDVVREGTIIRDRRNAGTCGEQTDPKAARSSPCDKAEAEPVNVPPPAGTMRRLDAISKSFSKR
jgi:hypothetical protein